MNFITTIKDKISKLSFKRKVKIAIKTKYLIAKEYINRLLANCRNFLIKNSKIENTIDAKNTTL